MQTSRSNSSLKFEVDPYQLIGPINAHGVGSRQGGVEVQVPKKVGLVIAMRPVAIAGPDAERHGRGNAGIARLDLWLAVLVDGAALRCCQKDGSPCRNHPALTTATNCDYVSWFLRYVPKHLPDRKEA